MMKVNAVRGALKAIRTSTVRAPSDRIIRKVSTRWLVAAMNLEYDRMIRLQFLEGAAHVPEGTWWKRGVMGLKAAEKHFEGHAVQEEWFDPGLTSMFPIIKRTLAMLIAKYPSIHGTDPLDIINAALMGISMNPTSGQNSRVLPAYEAGKYLREKVLNGVETPELVAKGLLGKFMVRRVLTYVRDKAKEVSIPVDEEGVIMDLRDDHDEGGGIGIENFISSLMFGPTEDPLARKVQDVMKASWPQNSAIDKWFGTIQMTGEVPQANEFAAQIGITPQTLGQRHLKPGLERAVRAIWNNQSLRRAIENRMIQEGLGGRLPDTLQEISQRPDRIKLASFYKLRTVLASYPQRILRRAGRKILDFRFDIL